MFAETFGDNPILDAFEFVQQAFRIGFDESYDTVWSFIWWLMSLFWYLHDLIMDLAGMVEDPLREAGFPLPRDALRILAKSLILLTMSQNLAMMVRLLCQRCRRRKTPLPRPAAPPAGPPAGASIDKDAIEKNLAVVLVAHLRPKVHLSTAYFLYFVGGLFGAHHFYLHQVKHGLIHILTGGFFGMGMVSDFFLMNRYVRDYNRGCHPKAPHCSRTNVVRSLLRVFFMGTIVFGSMGLFLVQGPRVLQFVGLVDVDALSTNGRNPYDVLEVHRRADWEDVVKAYRKQAKKNHPDMNPECGKPCEDKMAEVTVAYEFIKKNHGKSGMGNEKSMLEEVGDEWELVLGHLFNTYVDSKEQIKSRVKEEYMRRIKEVYRQYADIPFPEEQIPEWLDKNPGKEQILYKKLCVKYGVPDEIVQDRYDGKVLTWLTQSMQV